MVRRTIRLCVLATLLAPATAHAQQGKVSVERGSTLAVRATPGTGKVIARLTRGTPLAIACHRNGPLAPGRGGASRIWDEVRLPDGRAGWVADGFAGTDRDRLSAPLCDSLATPPVTEPGAQEGACGIVAPVALLPPFPSPEALITAAAPAAQASQLETGVPASVTLAQAVLESGGGTIAALANGFFGIKAQPVAKGTYRWEDVAVGCVLKKTWEVRRGRAGREIAAFRAYATLEDSVRDHGLRLRRVAVYAPAFAHNDDPVRFARAIARRYATDPAYAGKLESVMDRYDLTAYDA